MSTKAEQAVRHILDRVIRDRNFSWHMMGSESLSLCLQAEMERTGKTANEVERELSTKMKDADLAGAQPAELPILREKLDRIERESKGKPVDPSWRHDIEHQARVVAGWLFEDPTETGHLSGPIVITYQDGSTRQVGFDEVVKRIADRIHVMWESR